MKYAILLAMLYAPLSGADDYRAEILEHVITPCLQTRFGADVSLTPELDTCKFEISGLLMFPVELLRCHSIESIVTA